MSSVQIQPDLLCSNGPVPHSIEVRQYKTLEDLQGLRPAWNRLLQADPSAAIFVTPEWLTTWWAAYGQGCELCSLAFTLEGELIALAPMYIHKSNLFPHVRTWRFVGAGSGDSDSLNIIVASGHEQQVARAFVEHLRKNTGWDICSLETMPEESPMAAALRDSITREPWTVLSHSHPHSFIQLPRTWDDYLKTLRPDFRPLLTRYPKRLQSRYQVRMERCETLAQLAGALEQLFSLHQMRWTGRGEPGAFADPSRRDFYAQMAAEFLARGWLEFWFLTVAERVVATQFCFRYRDTVYLLQEGFDPAYTEDKVGYALRAHVLQTMIAQGVRCYDFLGGDDAYKLKFGATRTGYLDLHFAGPSARGRLELKKRAFVSGVKSWVKQRLPGEASAWLRNMLHNSAHVPTPGNF